MLPALVLAAGLGTRLDPITRLVAKAAVPLAGATLIERVLRWLVAQGVTDVIVNLHHRPDTITAIVGDGAQLGLQVRYSWEPRPLGSAGGPRHALPLLDADTFLIVNGDTLCDVPLAPLVEAHRHSGAAVTTALVPNPAPDRYNGIQLDAHDRVTGVAPRGQSGPSWHFVGVQIASASIFESLPDNTPAETVHGLYGSMMSTARGGWHGHRVDAPFFDVGTPADYLAAALAMAGGSPVEPSAVVAPGARINRSVVWSDATVGAHTRLDDCIVTNVDVPAGFTARRSVLIPARFGQPGDDVLEAAGLMMFPIDRLS